MAFVASTRGQGPGRASARRVNSLEIKASAARCLQGVVINMRWREGEAVMTDVPTANEGRQRAHAREASVQTYARIAGALFLISLVAGGFGEFFVPSTLIVSADATATAKNIIASNSLFRMGFASYLVEAMCGVGLTLVLYLLLKPVREDVALLAAFFRLRSAE